MIEFVATLLLLTIVSIANVHATGAKLSMTLEQAGFHRTLRYDVYFLQPWSPVPCAFRLEQTIPAGAYVDTDQLDELQRLNRLDYSTAAPVDVERSAAQSLSFVVRLYGNSSSMMSTIKLPLHFRYHTASAEHSSQSVTIEPPRMYMHSCNPMNAQLQQQQLYASDSDIPPRMHKAGEPVVANQLNGVDDEHESSRMSWLLVDDYELHSDPIVVSLPIGRLAAQPLVMFVTLAFAWAACYLIVREITNGAGEGCALD